VPAARSFPSAACELTGFASLSENQHLAIADRRFGTSFCIIDRNPLSRKAIDNADCKRILQIGDRRLLNADFLATFLELTVLFF
jgi:hypothetical protein